MIDVGLVKERHLQNAHKIFKESLTGGNEYQVLRIWSVVDCFAAPGRVHYPTYQW
jgi:predicted thioredoxin/glutaredoxin